MKTTFINQKDLGRVREKFERLAPKGAVKSNVIFMRRVSTHTLDSLKALGYTVILIGGSK